MINLLVNSLYRMRHNASAGASALALLLVASVAQAAIIEVREGERIQDAVNQATPGDEIRVYPGLYSETVYVDKDDITLRGIVEGDNWPHLDGKKQLNDAILYSGNGFSVEWFKITHYKGNAIMGQAGNNFSIRNNWVIDSGVYGIFPEFGENGLIAVSYTHLTLPTILLV